MQVEDFAATSETAAWVQGASSTVTVQLALALPAFAVITASPGATAVTLPSASTVATSGFADSQVSVSVVSAGATVANSVSLLPV